MILEEAILLPVNTNSNKKKCKKAGFGGDTPVNYFGDHLQMLIKANIYCPQVFHGKCFLLHFQMAGEYAEQYELFYNHMREMQNMSKQTGNT